MKARPVFKYSPSYKPTRPALTRQHHYTVKSGMRWSIHMSHCFQRCPLFSLLFFHIMVFSPHLLGNAPNQPSQ